MGLHCITRRLKKAAKINWNFPPCPQGAAKSVKKQHCYRFPNPSREKNGANFLFKEAADCRDPRSHRAEKTEEISFEKQLTFRHTGHSQVLCSSQPIEASNEAPWQRYSQEISEEKPFPFLLSRTPCSHFWWQDRRAQEFGLQKPYPLP